MCGLVGIYGYRSGAPKIDRLELLEIREAMSRRGPDGSGLWISKDGQVGLAHRRLSIIDLSDTGAQPMEAEGRHWVVFNGEIYNYRALRERLMARGYRFRSTSDTEVLLHLYAEYGREMVRHLRGMYAFAIWDERNRGLFLARDPFGIKPLYYSDDGETFRFASQVKALLRGGRIGKEPDAAGHVGFYLWGSVPEPYTLYKEIRALPAGSTLWVDERGGDGVRRFFSVTDELKRAEDDLVADVSDVREHLRRALRDTVEHHMVSDVPVGIFLSSGIDSTTLTALATETGAREIHTLTLGFREYQGTSNDETVYAQMVAERCGTRHHVHWVEASDFDVELNSLLHVMDQPSIDGVNSYFVSKAAAACGMKVALSGLGGDEIFGGYSSFRELPRMVNALAPWQAIPGLGRIFRRISAPVLGRLTSPKYAGLLEYGGDYGGAYLLRRGLFMPWELPKLMDPTFAKMGWEELQPLLRLADTVKGIVHEHALVASLELSWYMRNQLLRDTDWAGMAHSLEIRVPLVDVEFFRRLAPLMANGRCPAKQELAHTVGRTLLPEEIFNREKTGFGIPVRSWLAKKDVENGGERGLRGWAKHVLSMTSVGSGG